jgi:hypothetical protein
VNTTALISGNNFIGSNKEQGGWFHLMSSKFELIEDDFHQSVQETKREKRSPNSIEMNLQSDNVDGVDYKGEQQPISTKSSDSEPIHPLKLMVLKYV